MAKITLGQYADTRFRCERDAAADLRCATYVVGSPGVGKSTLLANLAEQFIAAGEGVLVVDVKGELAEDIAARTVHADRLVYVAPGETRFPSGKRYWTLNPLEFDRSQEHLEEIAVANLLSLFERMKLARMDVMVQVRQLLQMSARLALLLPEPCLNDLSEILHRQVLRERLLQDPRAPRAVRRFWENFNALTPAKQQEKITSTVPRLNEFLSSPVVEQLVGHPRSTIRLAEWLDAGKLVVCNLGGKLALETSALLGNFVVASLVNAAYARPTGHEQRTRVWRVIVDEFHELAGEQFAELITQGRKYRVFPVVAHQNLAQLPDVLANAVTQCPLRFFLATSAEDQGAIRRLFGEETSSGLANFPRFHARVHLREGVEGRHRQETLKLADWWRPRDPAQLLQALAKAEDARFTVAEAAIDPPMAASASKKPRRSVPPPVMSVDPVDDLKGAVDDRQDPADDLGADSSGGAPAREEAPALPPRSGPDDGLSPAPHPAGPGRARRARPARALDEWPDRETAL